MTCKMPYICFFDSKSLKSDVYFTQRETLGGNRTFQWLLATVWDCVASESLAQ